MVAYGEVQGKTWRSPSLRGLSDSQKLAWPYLLSNKHSNMMGYYELPLSYMADDLEWSIEKTKKIIETLEGRGLIAYDHAAQVVFVCRYLKYNRLSSGARERGAVMRLEEIPESPLLLSLSAAVNKWHPRLDKLRDHLDKQDSAGTLFGLQEDSKRTPRGLIDIDIDKEEDKEEDREEDSKNQGVEDYALTDQVIDYLNEKTHSSFRHSKASRENINARLNGDGLSLEDCKLLIDYKTAEWLNDPKTAAWLNPETLFRPTKWEKNLNGARRWGAKGRPSLNGEKRRLQTARGRSIEEYSHIPGVDS